MNKKKITFIFLAVVMGIYICFWSAAQIYNLYKPPIPEDGTTSVRQFMEHQQDLQNKREIK